jgi:hypothetical protein
MTADQSATTQSSEDIQMGSSGVPEGKGKGKALDPAVDVMDDDDDDDDDSEEEGQASDVAPVTPSPRELTVAL